MKDDNEVYFKFFRIFFISLLFQTLGLPACGPARPLASKAPSQIKQKDLALTSVTAEDLQLRVLTFLYRKQIPEDHLLLDLDQPSNSNSAIKIQIKSSENKIAIINPISISNPFKNQWQSKKETLLIWSEDSLHSPISTATYSHHFLDSNNQWTKNIGPFSAHRRHKTQEWLIPLSELFFHSNQYLHWIPRESDTQWIILEIILLDQTTHRFEINFRLKIENPN